MNQSIVRLQEINISNLKKVKSGDAAFPSYKREEFFSRESDILAMFGQEGSGRSSLVNALLILKNILLGDPFFDDIVFCKLKFPVFAKFF
jgi:ABC-type lipoprotein export system ATPase subunit